MIGGWLVIGTMPFVLSGGVANQTGQVSPMRTQALLRAARSFGVDTIDTTIAYGQYESMLGRYDLGAGIS